MPACDKSPMRRLLPVALGALLLAGCATGRKLPDYEKPLARAPVQQVRTTAYMHTEADHIKHGRKTAAGTSLRRGESTVPPPTGRVGRSGPNSSSSRPAKSMRSTITAGPWPEPIPSTFTSRPAGR